jgi:hypothetical protein
MPIYNTLGRKPGARNYRRTRAFCSDSTKNHVRLTENQLQEVTHDFMEWRWAHARINRENIILDARRDRLKMATFLSYLASGGFYRTVGFFGYSCSQQVPT